VKVLYPLYFDLRIWLKSNTPVGRISDRRNEELVPNPR
jgi:hypothetical protein